MAKILFCHDLVPGCRFEARGDSEEEVLAQAVDHMATAHHMAEISEQILAMVAWAIHDEVRVRSRAARA